MRCIEIEVHQIDDTIINRLTLTWDVLKLYQILFIMQLLPWLTLTWDVLKSAPDIAGLPATWLTLTWDVLKSCLLVIIQRLDMD